MQLHDTLDKLNTNMEHLTRLAKPPLTPERIELALQAAKRVRRDSTLAVRQLAATRDELRP